MSEVVNGRFSNKNTPKTESEKLRDLIQWDALSGAIVIKLLRKENPGFNTVTSSFELMTTSIGLAEMVVILEQAKAAILTQINRQDVYGRVVATAVPPEQK